MKPALNLQEAERFLRSLGACRVLVVIDPNDSGKRLRDKCGHPIALIWCFDRNGILT